MTCELILDGGHLHPAIVRLVFGRVRDGTAIVTDVIAAAARADGVYPLETLRVLVRDGQARPRGDGTIAGSTVTTAASLREAVRGAKIPLEDAVRAAASIPATLLGIDKEAGSIAPRAAAADLVVLDEASSSSR